MISNQHYIELYVNGNLLELESQDSLNLRINDVMFNPTKTTTTQATYSFSFDIPATPSNNKALDYANNLSKLNKFHTRYKAEVYADGELIFDGSLTIQKYSAKEKKYTCNLVNIKVNTLEDIFGDSVLSSLHWDIDFDGAPTINDVNYDTDTKYYFPLVAYGVFQKNYVSTDSVGSVYTAKNRIDKYNKWWVESFYPSLNVVETMKRAFESKGYTVGGSVFSDPNFIQLYASCNLGDEQVPIYNIGNPKFGSVSIDLTWNNYDNNAVGLEQDLKFPYEAVVPAVNASNSNSPTEYNFNTIEWWNMMDSNNNPSGVTINLNSDTYMFDPNESVIVIPADGWYRINLSCQASLSGTPSGTVLQWTNTFYDGDEMTKREVDIYGNNATFLKYFPLEIQLVRNYDDNIELIKGKHNVIYHTGNPNQTEYHYGGGSYTATTTLTNVEEWDTEFPHQDSWASKVPTKDNSLLENATSQRARFIENTNYGAEQNTVSGGYGTGTSTNTVSRRSGSHHRHGDGTDTTTVRQYRTVTNNTYGFMHKDNTVMPYDQIVSEAFICGLSTMSNGTVSVAKNGRSWSPLSSTNNRVMSNVEGLQLYKKTSDGFSVQDTDYCKNTYKDAPNGTVTATQNTMNGSISCCMYLNRNDILQLVAIQRAFEQYGSNNPKVYATSASCHVDITALTDRTEAQLRGDENWGYYSGTEFPTKLNLFNFTNNETKISEWIENIQKAFNLEIINQGNTVEINTQKGINKSITYAVNIDDRVSNEEVESEYISYPKEMAIKYKIDAEEYGFELTVPPEHINDEGDEWKKWGDSGFTVIKLSDDSYETSKSEVSTNFSYTYYMDFDFYQMLESGTVESSAATQIRIPVIEKSEYMAEGYSYDESMKHDGYSFTQRFWYRDQLSSDYVYLSSILSNGTREIVSLTYPMNSWLNFNLSYKDTEKSIASEYFNIHPMLASNYAIVETYLTPKEYKLIKNGALVHLDSDLYYTSEISGYDASGRNKTKLKLIKKVD